MKASELRIGNYVRDIADGIGQVRGTTHNALWIREESGPCPIQNFRPIPIDEEWLLKFGFKRRNSSQLIFQINNFNIRIKQKTWWCGIGISGYIVRVEYIHQLQNLYFALTGEELVLTSKATK